MDYFKLKCGASSQDSAVRWLAAEIIVVNQIKIN